MTKRDKSKNDVKEKRKKALRVSSGQRRLKVKSSGADGSLFCGLGGKVKGKVWISLIGSGKGEQEIRNQHKDGKNRVRSLDQGSQHHACRAC